MKDIEDSLQGVERTAKSKTLSEVNLFRHMAKMFQQRYGAIVVEETHQHYVYFAEGNTLSGNVIWRKKEISDILIIAYSPVKVMARATFLQAKVARGRDGLHSGRFFFHGDSHQYNLLSERPLFDVPSMRLKDVDVLHNAVLPSIGTYGVFYENNGRVNFAYQPANLLGCLRSNSSGIALFEMDFNGPQYSVPKLIPDLQYTLSMNEFEYAVTHLLVGSPIVLDPYYWGPYDDLYRIFTRGMSGSTTMSQYVQVERGIEHFISFMSNNSMIFFEDRERRGALERYSMLTSYIPPEQISSRWREEGGWSIDDLRSQEQNPENSLPQGPISMILINVDEILGNR